MGNWFSSSDSKVSKKDISSAATISDKDRAVYDLKVQRDRLQKYTIQIELVIAKEVVATRELLRRNQRDRALLTLKKKTYQEKLLAQCQDQMLNLEQMVHSIEFATIQVRIFDALSQGKNVLQQINREVSLDSVDKLMDETAEAIAYQREVDEQISRELSPLDDATVQHELELLEAQCTADLLSTAADVPQSLIVSVSQLPNVPSGVPTVTTSHTSKIISNSKSEVVIS